MTSIALLPFSVLLFSVLIICTHAGQSRFHAAKCITKSTRCTPSTSNQTERVCKPGIPSLKQSFKCRILACKWCILPMSAKTPFCSEAPLKWMCNRLNSNNLHKVRPIPSRKPRPPVKLSPRPSSGPSMTTQNGPPPENECPAIRNFAPANCVWQGAASEIVVDLGKVPPPSGWTCISRPPYTGMVYERNKNLGIDSKGANGKFCVKVRAAQSGNYFFTALSYAPDNTEHNDVWVQSSNKGFELWKSGTLWRIAGKSEWLKAYQNNGVEGLIDQFKTKDFDGHRFIVPDVAEGEVFEMCLSGRSYKYEMYRLYLIKCSGDFCKGLPYSNLFGKAPSACT